MREKPLAFLSLVKRLETAAGHKTSYKLLDPFPCITLKDGKPAYVEIQHAAKVIAEHAGLNGLTFTIAPTTMPPDTAGHIELRYGSPEVFVEISHDIFPFKDAVLATLCHELAHKFLHVNGISRSLIELEHELLTDVTTVYLGLGKIMLNGCECKTRSTTTVNGQTTTTTHTVSTGYISRDCFAFVYRLICEMRQIPQETYMAGLSDAGREAVCACEQQYPGWFLSDFHKQTGRERLSKQCSDLIQKSQEQTSEIERTIRAIESTLIGARATLQTAHKTLSQAASDILHLAEPRTGNPHLRYLACIEIRESVVERVKSSETGVAKDATCWNVLNEAAKQLPAPKDPTDPSMAIITCPLDGTRLRVPVGRPTLLVTCPSCKYRFLVNTTESKGTSQGSAGARRGSWLLRSFKAAFGR